MNNGQFYTYLHCKPDGTPFYVGKGKNSRCGQLSIRNTHHKNVVSKYGKENIRIFVFPCESEEQAFSDEIQQIAQLRRDGYELANKTNGGEGISGHIHSYETRMKLSDKAKGRQSFLGKHHNDETKKKISLANKGKKRTDEVREMISLRGKKRKMSDENRLKIISLHTGRKRTKETCDKISEAKLGKPGNGERAKGYIRTTESRMKQSKTRRENYAKKIATEINFE